MGPTTRSGLSPLASRRRGEGPGRRTRFARGWVGSRVQDGEAPGPVSRRGAEDPPSPPPPTPGPPTRAEGENG